MEVTAVLSGQHRQIRRAFGRTARPSRGRSPAFNHLVRLLSTHEAACGRGYTS